MIFNVDTCLALQALEGSEQGALNEEFEIIVTPLCARFLRHGHCGLDQPKSSGPGIRGGPSGGGAAADKSSGQDAPLGSGGGTLAPPERGRLAAPRPSPAGLEPGPQSASGRQTGHRGPSCPGASRALAGRPGPRLRARGKERGG